MTGMEARPRRWPDLLIGLLVLLLLAGFAALLVGQRPSPLAQAPAASQPQDPSGQTTLPDPAASASGQTGSGQTDLADIPGAPGTNLTARPATPRTTGAPDAQEASPAQTTPPDQTNPDANPAAQQDVPTSSDPGTATPEGSQADAKADTVTPDPTGTGTEATGAAATRAAPTGETTRATAPAQTPTPQTAPAQTEAAPTQATQAATAKTQTAPTPDASTPASAQKPTANTTPDSTRPAASAIPVVPADPIPAAPVDPPVAPPLPVTPPVETRPAPASASTSQLSQTPGETRSDQAQASPSGASTAPAAPSRTGNAVPTSEERTPLRSDFRISLGTFGSTGEVQRSTGKVQDQGYTVYPIEVGDQVVAQVGPFADEATARRALADIERTYPGAILYRPRGYRPDAETATTSSTARSSEPEKATDTSSGTAVAPQDTNPPRPTERAAAPSGPVYLQVGAFDRVESAQRLVGMLRDEGYAPTVNAPENGKVTVLIGPFSGDAVTRAEANLDENNFDHFRIR